MSKGPKRSAINAAGRREMNFREAAQLPAGVERAYMIDRACMPVGKKAVDEYFNTTNEPVEESDFVDYKRINVRYSGMPEEPDRTSEDYWSDKLPSSPTDPYTAYEEYK